MVLRPKHPGPSALCEAFEGPTRGVHRARLFLDDHLCAANLPATKPLRTSLLARRYWTPA